MFGTKQVRFSELFNDTMETHGYWFAYDYYVAQNGMGDFEFSCWVKEYMAQMSV